MWLSSSNIQCKFFLKKKIERLEFDNSDYDNNSANVLTENYEIQLNFKYLHKESLYIFDNFNMKIKKDFVKGIYKMK